jgi:hypothetical protein
MLEAVYAEVYEGLKAGQAGDAAISLDPLYPLH